MNKDEGSKPQFSDANGISAHTGIPFVSLNWGLLRIIILN